MLFIISLAELRWQNIHEQRFCFSVYWEIAFDHFQETFAWNIHY